MQLRFHGRPGTAKIFLLSLTALFVVIAVLLGIRHVRSSIRQFQDRRFIRKVLLMQESLNEYANQAGSTEPVYPAMGKKLPKELSSFTPIKGTWKIRHFRDSKNRPVTDVVVEQPNRTMKEMENLDALIDDGDLATGHFRMIGPGTYSLQILSSDPAQEQKSQAKKPTADKVMAR
ncbi:MAG: hypothetical protein LBB14_00005 [Puniceicoccales bacterium]|jgi:hypothetical protein|nr:hypothetical protein [Puniceicoccales bacterium]